MTRDKSFSLVVALKNIYHRSQSVLHSVVLKATEKVLPIYKNHIYGANVSTLMPPQEKT